jgi:hypothetical protein
MKVFGSLFGKGTPGNLRLCLKRGLTLSGKAENTGKIELPPKGQTPFQTEPSLSYGFHQLHMDIFDGNTD